MVTIATQQITDYICPETHVHGNSAVILVTIMFLGYLLKSCGFLPSIDPEFPIVGITEEKHVHMYMYDNAYYSPSKNDQNVINMVDYNGVMHSNANEQLYTVPRILTHFEKVQFSCSAVSDSLQSHGQQHTWLPCPSPTPEVYSNSCPLSQ